MLMGYYGRRSRGPSPRCKALSCGHAKRKHRRGYYACQVTGCRCEDFAFYSAEELEQQKREREAQQAMYEARRQADEKRYAELALKRELEAQQYESERQKLLAVEVFKYGSFTALLQDTMKEPMLDINRTRPDNALKGWDKFMNGEAVEHMGSWAGELGEAKTLEEVSRFMLSGWEAGLVQMREAIGQIPIPQLADVRRKGIWSDIGDTLSLDRLYSGDTENCWRTTRRAKCGAPPKIQLLVEALTNAGTRPSQAFWRGAAATMLAEAALSAGYAVAVDVCMSVEGYTTGGASYLQVTRVKDYDSPLNIGSVAAMTANVAMLRVITFAHGLSRSFGQITETFGHCTYFPTEEEFKRRGCLDVGSIFLKVPHSLLSVGAAKAWLELTLAKLEEQKAEVTQ